MRKVAVAVGMLAAMVLIVVLGIALAPPVEEGEVVLEETPVEEDACQGYEQVGGFCVSPEGDVYKAGFPMYGCVTGTTFGYCVDENGKVSPNDSLPEDVCGDGTYRAPCYPQEKPPHPLEQRQYLQEYLQKNLAG